VTLPKGWTQTRASASGTPTLKPVAQGKIDVSVWCSPVPPAAAREREPLARPDRLGPIDESALAAVKSSMKTKAGAVAVYDLVSGGERRSRMLAAILASEEGTWFIKMLGDERPVASARPDFLRLLRSLRFDAQTRNRVWGALTSLKLTITCLALLMVLVVACTLAQARMGVYGAVNAYIRSLFRLLAPAGTMWEVPVFPGAAWSGSC